MRTTARNLFTTIRTEGALLPADFLQHVAEGNPEIEGLSPDSYHLVPGEKLNEAINRSWNRLLGVWRTFKAAAEKLGATDVGTGLTRERWLLPLFQELGYGRVQTAKAFEIGGKSYPISHGWESTPIHLVGCKIDLDRRTSGVVGAARTSPHGLVQEMLNRSEVHRWGFVSNGHRLRVLRDNITLTRQAYVEFDLAAMFDGEVYADFVVLWLLCHQSRVEGARPELCWLEKWSQLAEKRGTRVLEDLRTGVEAAINALGSGFLAHLANRELCTKLSSAALNSQDYYRQLLRVVYRILFLFVAEDRGLLFEPKSSAAARELYSRFYSIARLRRLAERRVGTQHTDLWRGLTLVFEKLDTGCAELALPALGSFLWSREATAEIAGCELANRDLLKAIHSLAFTVDSHVRRMVDYKNLGPEELGSIYEALLEQHPKLNVDAATFSLATAAGNERKTTGSYYTPTSLVNCLLDSGLDPVLEEATKKPNPEQRILDLKICDPATGSGHFLIAAAHRLAKRLAAVRTGDDEPSPEATRSALRDVIGRCLYGVDVNPMGVELCKVSLWMEALEPGKPLSFLDHHIQCGNSLLGATPRHLREGLPDDAFRPVAGDDKIVCTEAKKRNKEERSQLQLFHGTMAPWHNLGNLPAAMLKMDAMSDDTADELHRKEECYAALVSSSAFLHSRFLADAWCAAFVWKKTHDVPYPITNDVLRRIGYNRNGACDPWMRDEIKRLRHQYQFFHWHLAFPDVFHEPAKGGEQENAWTGWSGGFDVMLGNPPWVRQELLKSSKQILVIFESFSSTADSSVFFLERALDTARPHGRVAMLTPNKWFRANYAEQLRKILRERSRLLLLIDFGHSRTLFPDADTFPAAVIFEPMPFMVPDKESALFVHAHDLDREQHSLEELIREYAIHVPHVNLRPDRWQLEDSGASDMLNRLLGTGRHLYSLLKRPILSGLKTGFNQAFYLDTSLRDSLVAADPNSEILFKKLLRGRDVKRWAPRWDGQWHIVIPSSQNHSWPWSSAPSEAEPIFERTYPAVYAYLKRFEKPLRERQDKGANWWELRACDYYGEFEKPKVIVQCIAYYSQFAFDDQGYYVNNKAIVIPTDDLFVLAILNSRVMWWIVNRVFQHMKDEGLSVDVQFLRRLPVPTIGEQLRVSIEHVTRELMMAMSVGMHQLNDILRLEMWLNDLVQEAFDLTDGEREVLINSLPLRDPISSIVEYS